MTQAVSLDAPARAAPRPARTAELGPRSRTTSPGWVAPALALVACLVCWAAGWRGTDWAAQMYRAGQVERYGLALWDPGWYGGTYPLNYSLLFPLVAGYLGLWPVAALSATGAAAAFDRLVASGLGWRRAASAYFALTTLVEVAIGQLPTLAGEALALACVLCLRSRRPAARAGGLALGALAGLASPVAGALLALALAAWGLPAHVRPRAALLRLGAGALTLAASAALPLAFPEPGWFPFTFSEAAAVVLIALLLASPLLGPPAVVRRAAVLYALVTVALLVQHTPMGDNDARLAAYVGVPLALAYLPAFPRRARSRLGGWASWPAVVLAGGVAASLVVWDWSPVAEAFGGATDGASSQASYYRPLEAQLARLSGGEVVRVEVPPLAHHWEAAYLAPRFVLARGWERQLDLAYAHIFYARGPIRPGPYREWLLDNGVTFVALAAAPLDYSAVEEAALLRSGQVPGLALVWHSQDWEVWKVTGSSGLAGAPARVDALRPGRVALSFSKPGTSVVKVRWSSYWSLGRRDTQTACLKPAPGDWTEVSSRAAGEVSFSVSLVGADRGKCSAASGAAPP